MGVVVVAADDCPSPEDDAKPLVGGDGAACGANAAALEASTLRKLNRRVLAALFAVAMLCYIDRTNLAFASVSMTSDLGFNAQVYGLGSGLFFVGYSLSMVPAQLALLRLGAPRALALIVTAWGLTAMAFCTLQGERQFYLLRLLLGVAESGAFPAIWFYINSWFPPSATTLAYSVVEAAVGAANCAAAPLAAALLTLDGAWGMRGWRILFFVEGMPSVLLGLFIFQALPRHVHQARFLTPPERAWLAAASAGARRNAEAAEALSARRMVGEALRNGRLWAIMAVGVMKNAAMTGVLFFAPKLVDAIINGGAVDVRSSGAGRGISSGGGGGGGGGGLSSSGLSSGSISSLAAANATTAAGALRAGAGRRALLGGAALSPSAAGAQAALLTAVPFVLAALTALWLGKRAQERGDRCRHMAVPWALSALLFVLFGPAAAHSPALGFATLTAAVASSMGANALLNMLASAVSAGPSQAVSLSIYNAVANIGGLIGPVFVGFAVHHTGVYSAAMAGLGLLLLGAAALVWRMRAWGLG